MFTAGQKKVLIIAFVALIILLLFLFGINYYVFKKTEKKAVPSVSGVLELSPEVLKSLTPPPDAKPIELSPAVLKSLTPPPDAEPVELSPEVLKSLTPRR